MSSKKKASAASACERDYALMKRMSAFSEDEKGVSPLKRLKFAMAAAGDVKMEEAPMKSTVKGTALACTHVNLITTDIGARCQSSHA